MLVNWLSTARFGDETDLFRIPLYDFELVSSSVELFLCFFNQLPCHHYFLFRHGDKSVVFRKIGGKNIDGQKVHE